MPVDVKVELSVADLEKIQKKMEQIVRDLRGGPALTAMKTATLGVQRRAKLNAPVDTGRLRASIWPSVKQSGNIITGVIGSNVEYAPYQEFGTYGSKGGYYVGLGAEKVREGRAGRKGLYYMRRALEQSAKEIRRLLSRFVEQVVKK